MNKFFFALLFLAPGVSHAGCFLDVYMSAINLSSEYYRNNNGRGPSWTVELVSLNGIPAIISREVAHDNIGVSMLDRNRSTRVFDEGVYRLRFSNSDMTLETLDFNLTCPAENPYLSYRSYNTVDYWGILAPGVPAIPDDPGHQYSVTSDDAGDFTCKSEGPRPPVQQVVFPAGPTPTPVPTASRLQIKLNDITGSFGVVGAVTLDGRQLVTDGNGFLDFGIVTHGSHTISVYSIGAESQTRVINHTGATSVTFNLVDDEGIPPVDIAGDSTPDLLWQNTYTGQIAYWQMSGTQSSGGGLFQHPSNTTALLSWRLVGAFDLNRDNHPDLVWQHRPSGQIAYWLMNRQTPVGGGVIAGTESGLQRWRLASVYDLNRDGQADLVWQDRVTGHIAYWYLNNLVSTARVVFPGSVAALQYFKLAAIADLNHDGQGDLIWQNRTDGSVAYWHMYGVNAIDGGVLNTTPGLGWRLAGASDVNADGWVDLLWQERGGTGKIAYWLLIDYWFQTASYLASGDYRGWRF
ncbi:MAG: VCBS repeat-containing protein [Bdellovibrionia bacterium]